MAEIDKAAVPPDGYEFTGPSWYNPEANIEDLRSLLSIEQGYARQLENSKHRNWLCYGKRI